MTDSIFELLRRGTVIPAHPLALTESRQLDERRQRALSRYYIAAGAGGLAVAVHTTQFALRSAGLYATVLKIAAEETARAEANGANPIIRVAGICGKTLSAVKEAQTARECGYHLGLLNLGAAPQGENELIRHCNAIADVIPVFGFYLQPAVGGRELPFSFWRRFVEIENVKAIKIAAFNRYQTIDVIRALAESGRSDIALYTGNDDNIVMDLLTEYRFQVKGETVSQRFVGGLLGHWAVWTKAAVDLFHQCRDLTTTYQAIPQEMASRNIEVTDMNAVLFDAGNQFHGCIPGIHTVLHRQGLLSGTWCLNPEERLSPGQAEELDRIQQAYPHLTDDDFVREHLDEWLD